MNNEQLTVNSEHAARVGHDAERAELIAAFLHRNERRHAACADRLLRRRREVELSSTGNQFRPPAVTALAISSGSL